MVIQKIKLGVSLMSTSLYALFLLTNSVVIPQSCNIEGTLHLYPKSDYVNVRYEFSQDVKSIKLGLPGNIKDTLSVSELSVVDNKTTIRHRKEQQISPEVKFYTLKRSENATYTPYIKLEDVYAIYLPYILPEKIQKKNNEWQDIIPECISLEIDNNKVNLESMDGFYVKNNSPEGIKLLDKDRLNYHFSIHVPKWLQELIEGKGNEVFELFTNKIGKLERSKNVIVSYLDAEKPFFDGGVAGDTLLIRFGGDAWKNFDSGANSQITNFIVHEFFHFWNYPDHSAPSWFHEGSAEFAANYITSVSEFEFNNNNTTKKLECMFSHGGFAAHLKSGWHARYFCGQAFWSGIFGSPEDFFSFWRKKQKDKVFTDLEFLLNHVPLPIKQTLEILLNSNLKEDDRYEAYLSLIGKIVLSRDVVDPIMREVVLEHIMASKCNGMVSYSAHHDYIHFYHHERCSAPFSQPLPLIYKVNEIDISGDPYELLKNYLSRCQQIGDVKLSGKEDDLSVTCTIPSQLIENISFINP